MKTSNFFSILGLYVILLFGAGIGDTPGICNFMTTINDGKSWGFRHYLYGWMCFTLFVISIVRITFWINKNWKS